MGKIVRNIVRSIDAKYISPRYLHIEDAYKMAAIGMGTAGATVVGTVVGTVGLVTAAAAMRKVKNLERNLVNLSTDSETMQAAAEQLLATVKALENEEAERSDESLQDTSGGDGK